MTERRKSYFTSSNELHFNDGVNLENMKNKDKILNTDTVKMLIIYEIRFFVLILSVHFFLYFYEKGS